MAAQIEKIREIVERVASGYGLEVVDVELKGGGKARTLRITIDRPEATTTGGGVTHEDCSNVSREVGTILDVEDAIPGGSYTLEVSSPGLDRKLLKPRDYERFAGSRIKLMTREPIEGNRFFEGRLRGLNDGRVTIEPIVGKKKEPKPPIEIELGNVERANLVPEF